MYESTLQELGLSPNEARIYEALLELGESSISGISTHTNIHRRNVYDAINRLVEKGFIIPVMDSKERRYLPVEPNKFLEIVEEKRSNLQQILPKMQELFEQKRAKEGIYIYKGLEGGKNVLRDLLNIGKTVYSIGAKEWWTNPPSDPFSETVIKEAIRKKIKYYTLFDSGVKKEAIMNLKTTQKPKIDIEYRFLPEKYSSTSAIDIYEDRVAIYTGGTLSRLEENVSIFLTISQNLADSYRQWFQFMWDRCSQK